MQDEYEQQQFWIKTRSEELLNEINKSENKKIISVFFEEYRLKHSKYKIK